MMTEVVLAVDWPRTIVIRRHDRAGQTHSTGSSQAAAAGRSSAGRRTRSRRRSGRRCRR